MQKQYAQPDFDKSPGLSFTDESFPQIQDLNLNERTVSVAQTNDDGNEKKQCCLFEQNFFKTKTIQKKNNRNERIDSKKKHNYQKKCQILQLKIEELEKQIHSLRRKQESCPQCHFCIPQNERLIRDLVIPQEYYQRRDEAGTCQANTSKDSIEFEKINFLTPLLMTPQMQQKSWIFLGTMMICMGSKIMDVDGTINVFKILNESVDNIRRQVEKCQENINLDFYLRKEQLVGRRQAHNDEAMGMSFDPFFAKHEDHPIGFQLEGVKLQTVEQFELFFDQKFKFSVKYEALITVMQYLRDHCNIC